jgi:hypothetical protein
MPSSSPRPHAVTEISRGAITTTFTHDANSNQTSGLGRSIAYSSYNKPSSITQAARTISFLDDVDHQRFKQVAPEGATLYLSAFGVLAELTNPGASGEKWTDYLVVGGMQVGMRVIQTATETVATRYFDADHLGSISVITSESGVVMERPSYDAWGKRRHRTAATTPPAASRARARAALQARSTSRSPGSFTSTVGSTTPCRRA